MKSQAKLSTAAEILPLRTRHRAEMNCQIVHDSIHVREGWTLSYLLEVEGTKVGFGSVAIGGPWTDKSTCFECYVYPKYLHRLFDLFETFLAAAGRPRFFEVQSNDVLPTMMALTYGQGIATQAIVFHDQQMTSLPANGSALRCVSTDEE